MAIFFIALGCSLTVLIFQLACSTVTGPVCLQKNNANQFLLVNRITSHLVWLLKEGWSIMQSSELRNLKSQPAHVFSKTLVVGRPGLSPQPPAQKTGCTGWLEAEGNSPVRLMQFWNCLMIVNFKKKSPYLCKWVSAFSPTPWALIHICIHSLQSKVSVLTLEHKKMPELFGTGLIWVESMHVTL